MLRVYKPTNREYSRNVATSREIYGAVGSDFPWVARKMDRRSGRLPALARARSGSGDCPLGHLMFQTKRWSEAIRNG